MNDLLQFASKYNKNYTTQTALNDHKANYDASDDYIRRCNEKADASGDAEAVHCGHNRFSDWTDEEFKQFASGIKPIDDSEIIEETNEGASGSGRRLDHLPNIVNHYKWMGPVKDQGYCGSCAAFAATSTLEGSMAIKAGNSMFGKRKPERISE